ncbi:hypothetical protein ACH3XW_27475 [Acanthocheilonema viteae]
MMIITLSAVIITLFLLLPLCTCKRKAKPEKFTSKIKPQNIIIKEKEMEEMEFERAKTIAQPMITAIESLKKSSKKDVKIANKIQKQLSNLETAKSYKSDVHDTEETQCSQSESMGNIEEIRENEKEIFEVNKSQKTSSHSTLQHVQPRVRFFERAKEIEQCEPIDKYRNEYRTLILDEDKNRITQNIYPREVRQQDITEYKIEKYNVVGYQIPEILEYTCREDNF